jgi:hypothetical protein
VSKSYYEVVVGSHQIPLYKFCEYKYLLNLPGHQPWSYRFKYLFLMKGLVINIDLRQHFGSHENGRWINFFDPFITPDVDFVNLVYHWHEGEETINKENYKKLVQDVETTYRQFENDPDDYDTMVDNGYRKVQMIDQDMVYESLYMVVRSYAQRFT